MLLEPSTERLKAKVSAQSISPRLGVAKAILLSAIDALSPDRHCKEITKALVKRASEVVEKISDYAETAEVSSESLLLILVADLERTLRDIHLLIQAASKRDIFFHIRNRKQEYEARYSDLKNRLEKVLDIGLPEYGSSSSQLSLPSKKNEGNVSPSFFAGANGVLVHDSAFYNICGNMTLISSPNVQDHGEAVGNGSSRVIAKEDIILTKEIYKGRGYRLHAAQTSGMAVAVKIYEKSGSKERRLKDERFHRKIMHPNIPQVVGISPESSEVSFLVIGGDYEGAAESLVSFALSNDFKRGLLLGLQTVAGLSSGLDYLHSMNFSFASAVLDDFVVLVGQDGKISISFDANGADNVEDCDQGSDTSDDTSQGLSIFNALCKKTFDAACKAHYDQQQIRRAVDGGYDPDDDESRFEELDDDGQSISPAAPTPSVGPSTPKKKSKPAAGQRRQLVWKNHMDATVTLEEIARKFNVVLEEVSSGYGIMLTRRRGLPIPGAVHRCPGYTRQEITLSADINRIFIVSHLTPTPHEICPVCKMVVKSAEVFNCSCGKGDDESIPTVRCATCFEWHHRPCVGDREFPNRAFRCERCQGRGKSRDMGSSTPTKSSSNWPKRQTSDDGSPILFHVKTLYDYKATIVEEFDFLAGDVIAVTSSPEDGWWSGELLDESRRQRGSDIFPCNYVAFHEGSLAEQARYEFDITAVERIQGKL